MCIYFLSVDTTIAGFTGTEALRDEGEAAGDAAGDVLGVLFSETLKDDVGLPGEEERRSLPAGEPVGDDWSLLTACRAPGGDEAIRGRRDELLS